MKILRSTLSLTSILILLGLGVDPAAAYYVDYSYYVYATGSDGIPLQDAAVLEGETYVYDEHTKTGENGNYGTVRYCADIAAATVSAHAHSHGVQTGPTSYSSASARIYRIGFREEFTFTVPAGEYPAGVQVGIACRAYGFLSAEVGAGAKVRCDVDFGTSHFDTDVLEVPVDEVGTIWVDEFRTLVHEIVDPGTTLAQDRDYEVNLYVYFRNGRTWATESLNQIGDATIDFEQGIRITELLVPDNVSWVSASGEFPDLTTSAPDLPGRAGRPQLLPNQPNPFNPKTSIRFHLPRPAAVTLSIHDTAGRRVRLLAAGVRRDAGLGAITWAGEDDRGLPVAAGVYLCRLAAEGRVETRKLCLLK